MKYSIVIPTYNHCDDLLKPCVESILKYTHMTDVELIISANGCTDRTLQYVQDLQHKFESIGMTEHFKYVWSDTALGYSAANNVAIRTATSDLIVLLNNDVVLLDQPAHTWLRMLHAPFEQEDLTGISCVVKSACDFLNHDFAMFFCVMIHRKVFDTIGLLNEAYQVGGGEDIEFSIKCEQAGFLVSTCSPIMWQSHAHTYTGKFPIYHKGSSTMQDTQLVPNWADQLTRNLNLLKHNHVQGLSHTSCESNKQVAEKYAWLENVNTEAPELFKEVIVNNTYKLKAYHVLNRSVIDVGANMGMFSIMCAALGASQVLACEPVSSTVNLLTHHVRQAQLQNQIKCVRAAITGVSQGPIMINMHADSGKNSLYDVGAHTEWVPTRSLASLVASCTHAEILLKLDCEGAEYDILLDSEDQVFDRIHMIMMETHGDAHPVHKGIPILHDRLRSLGFHQQSEMPYGIWWYDHTGTRIRWEPLNMSIELWSK